MAENPKEWPRVHTCLLNWCPEKSERCGRCDAVLDIILKQEPLGADFQKVLDDTPRAR